MSWGSLCFWLPDQVGWGFWRLLGVVKSGCMLLFSGFLHLAFLIRPLLFFPLNPLPWHVGRIRGGCVGVCYCPSLLPTPLVLVPFPRGTNPSVWINTSFNKGKKVFYSPWCQRCMLTIAAGSHCLSLSASISLAWCFLGRGFGLSDELLSKIRSCGIFSSD